MYVCMSIFKLKFKFSPKVEILAFMKVQRKFWKGPGMVQGRFRKGSEKVQRRFREGSGNVQ